MVVVVVANLNKTVQDSVVGLVGVVVVVTAVMFAAWGGVAHYDETDDGGGAVAVKVEVEGEGGEAEVDD